MVGRDGKQNLLNGEAAATKERSTQQKRRSTAVTDLDTEMVTSKPFTIDDDPFANMYSAEDERHRQEEVKLLATQEARKRNIRCRLFVFLIFVFGILISVGYFFYEVLQPGTPTPMPTLAPSYSDAPTTIFAPSSAPTKLAAQHFVGMIFFDDFCGWRDAATNRWTTDGDGDWTVTECAYAQVDPLAEDAYAWVGEDYEASTEWTDYSFQLLLEASLYNGEIDDGAQASAGAFVRATASSSSDDDGSGIKSGYFVNLHFFNAELEISAKNCGDFSTNTTNVTHAVLKSSTLTELVIIVVGNEMVVRLNGLYEYGPYQLSSSCAAGSVGLKTDNGNGYFYNTTVWNYTGLSI